MSSQTPRVPISQILANKDAAGEEEPKKKSREDWRKAKELEEARKAGKHESMFRVSHYIVGKIV